MSGARAFGLDKRNGKIGGLCAGFAVVMPFSVLAYLGLWMLLPDRSLTTIAPPGEDRRADQGEDGPLRPTAAEAWAYHRSVEVRLERIEAYYTSHNTSLARQIEALMHDAVPADSIDAARAASRHAPTAGFGRATRPSAS